MGSTLGTLIRCLVLVSLVQGCSTWSSSSVDTTHASTTVASPSSTNPEKVMVTEGDLTDRHYASLGDITVTVNKTTAFHPTPTREQVNKKLQDKAATLGANAVIFVRYGEWGVSPLSWGSLEGKGRAIKFQ
jgi:uncharacterized protein YbjQ (UPF0145 family)